MRPLTSAVVMALSCHPCLAWSFSTCSSFSPDNLAADHLLAKLNDLVRVCHASRGCHSLVRGVTAARPSWPKARQRDALLGDRGGDCTWSGIVSYKTGPGQTYDRQFPEERIKPD